MKVTVFETKDGTHTIRIDGVWVGILESHSHAPNHTRKLLDLIAKGALHTPGVSLLKVKSGCKDKVIVGSLEDFSVGEFSV